MLSLNIKNLSDTEKLAKIFSELIDENLIITLNGNLGAGKTTFTKFFAKHLGVKTTVNSPTFNILKEYEFKNKKLYHIDAYRLENSEEDLGFEEIFYDDNVCVIEWSEFIKDFIPKDNINIEITLSDNIRVVNIYCNGRFKIYEKEILEKWQQL